MDCLVHTISVVDYFKTRWFNNYQKFYNLVSVKQVQFGGLVNFSVNYFKPTNFNSLELCKNYKELMEIINEIIESCAIEVFNLEKLKELFELRLALINTNAIYKTDFEKNEIEIQKIQTQIKIEKLEKLIKEKTQEFLDTIRIYTQELSEINE